MEEYVVSIWETLRKDVVVKATSEKEAQNMVLQAYKDGKFSLTMDDFIEDFTESDVETLEEAISMDDVNKEELIYLD